MLIASFHGRGRGRSRRRGHGSGRPAEAKVQNPCSHPGRVPTGACRRSTRSRSTSSSPRWRQPWPRPCGIDKVANDPSPPTFENTIAGLGQRPRPGSGEQHLRSLQLDMSTEDFRRSKRRWRPGWPPSPTRSPRTRSSSSASPPCTRAREREAHAEQKRGVARHTTSSAPARSRRGREEAHVRDQPAAGLALHEVTEPPADETDYVLFLDKGGPRRASRLAASAASAAAERTAEGKWLSQPRVEHGAVPDVFRSADLREKVWKTYYSRGDHETRKTTTPSSPRS